jgi:hypothetical protein
MNETENAERRQKTGTAGDDWTPIPAVPDRATHGPTVTGTHEQPITSVPHPGSAGEREQFIVLLARLARRAATQKAAQRSG